MGDRCYCWGKVLAKDWTRFKEVCDIADDGADGQDWAGLVSYTSEEENYGMWAAVEAAAREGLTFVAYNAAGDSYGSCVSVSFGDGEYLRHPLDHDSFVTVRLGDDGVLDPQELADGQAACAAIKAVEQAGQVAHDMVGEGQDA